MTTRPTTNDQRPTPLYAIASGKGGVGKTSFTLNLATLLAKQGKKVLVLDGDTGLANLDVQLNIKPTHDLSHVISGTCTLEHAITPTPQGFSIIAGRAGDNRLANLPLPDLHKLLTTLRTVGQTYDITLIDIAAGIHTQALAMCAAADSTLLLTTPDPAAFTDAYALLKLLYANHGIANASLIVNQASAREGQHIHTKLHTAASHFLGLPDLPYLGHIPPCRQYASAVKMHQLASIAYPNSPAVEAIAKLAKLLPLT